MPTERVLESAPGMLGLFARAGAAMIPGAAKLPGIGGARGKDVPDQVLVLNAAAVDRERLAAYNRVCGFDLSETLPATYPHMLAFPLHLALMTDPSFPFPAIGLVHIYNKIDVHRPINASEELRLKVWPEPLVDHPRGRAVSIITQAFVGDELVWDEVSTNLRIGRSNEKASAPAVRSAEGLPAAARWKLPADLGRRYAAVSGDYNPIHVHGVTAKLLGFPSAIAHGMWTKARCLAQLDGALPEKYSVEVAFKRPILLPASVEYAEQTVDGGIAFGVRDARKGSPHLDGFLSA
jgi:acyl dehydratase